MSCVTTKTSSTIKKMIEKKLKKHLARHRRQLFKSGRTREPSLTSPLAQALCRELVVQGYLESHL